MDEADIPYLLDALASATGGLAAARAAAQLAECLASATGPEVTRAHAPALRALAPAALAARGAGDATLAHAATLCAVLASRACAAAAPRSRAEIAAVAELLRNATAPAPRPSPSKRRRRRGFFAAGAAEQAAAIHEDAPSAELARCLAALRSSSSESAAASTTAVGASEAGLRCWISYTLAFPFLYTAPHKQSCFYQLWTSSTQEPFCSFVVSHM